MTPEAIIKSAIIDALIAHEWVDDDTVLISELPVASWSRRADLVLANGKLIAFEIKSDADKTDRLLGQLNAYRSCVEGVTVVTGPRHAEHILTHAPAGTGVFVFEEGENGVTIEMLRKPHIGQMTADAAIALMQVPDLMRLVRRVGGSLERHDRHSLEMLVRALPPPVLRKFAIESLKRRYRQYHSAFMTERAAGGTTISALPKLRRPGWLRPPVQDRPMLPENSVASALIPRLQITPRLRR